MEKSHRKKSIKNSCNQKSNKLLSSEDYFIGFELNDEVLNIIDEKRKSINFYIIQEEGGVPKTVAMNKICSDYILNHFNSKKKQSKSRTSSPETNDDIQNSNKRLKLDVSNETVESLDEDVPPSLELTTPTFNLTSATSKARRSVRKVNVDISDPIFKLPFEYGWKRELVYRTSGESTASNRVNRNGDVYYYSPLNRKLRSLREIQEQLDLSLNDKCPLTIESFTFLKQPIGINDRSKELIRDANTKLSKEDSFVGVSVRPKKPKTPVQQPFEYEMSDTDNNKSSNKMKIVFKNVKQSPRSKSKSKRDKSNLETLNTSSSTPEYLSEDCQAIQSSETPKTSPSKTDDETNVENIDRRNSEKNGSLKEMPNSMDIMLIYNCMGVAMRHVFKYLKIQDLLSASRVCTSWNLAAMDRRLWKSVCLKNSMVYDWDQFVESINYQWTQSLDCKRMLIPTRFEKFEDYWLRFSKAIKKATRLKVIELYRCPPHIVEDIIYSLPQLVILKSTSLKNPISLKDPRNNEFMTLNLAYVGQLANLIELRLKGQNGLRLTPIPTFINLKNLQTLSLTSVKSFPKDFCRSLETVTSGLKIFEIGDCDHLFKDFAEVLKRFNNLTSLRLENCCGKWDTFAVDVFGAIRSLKKLKVLELINIEFSSNVEEELEKCCDIRGLVIIPYYISQSATTNYNLVDCLKKLSKTLTHLVWGLTNELLRVTELFITQYQKNIANGSNKLELPFSNDTSNNIPILRARRPKLRLGEEPVVENEKDKDKSDNIDILSIPALQNLLDTTMIHTKCKVIKTPFSGTTRICLADHYNDI